MLDELHESLEQTALPTCSWSWSLGSEGDESMRIQSLSISRTASTPFTVYFFQWLFLPLLPTPVDLTHDFPATQFFKSVWLQVQKKRHAVIWKSKSRPAVKMVTKAEEQTRDWMSLPYTGQWWGSGSCMRWSTSQSCPHTPAASNKACSLLGQSETATAASTVIFSLQMHKLIA